MAYIGCGGGRERVQQLIQYCKISSRTKACKQMNRTFKRLISSWLKWMTSSIRPWNSTWWTKYSSLQSGLNCRLRRSYWNRFAQSNTGGDAGKKKREMKIRLMSVKIKIKLKMSNMWASGRKHSCKTQSSFCTTTVPQGKCIPNRIKWTTLTKSSKSTKTKCESWKSYTNSNNK